MKHRPLDPGESLEFGYATVSDLLTKLAHKASVVLPGEALPVHVFHARGSAEEWGNRLVMRRLVPEDMRLEVRGTTLFIVRPKEMS